MLYLDAMKNCVHSVRGTMMCGQRTIAGAVAEFRHMQASAMVEKVCIGKAGCTPIATAALQVARSRPTE